METCSTVALKNWPSQSMNPRLPESCPAVTVGNAVGRGLIGGSGAKEAVVRAISDGSFIPSHNGDNSCYAERTRITVEEASALQSYPVAATKPQTAGRTENYGTRPDRPVTAPAFTIVGHDGHPRGGFQWKHENGETQRLATEELATLQTYEPPFVWCGTKTKQFLQIGNAVPPLLAEAILAALIGIKEGR